MTALTKENIKALRTADAVSFHFTRNMAAPSWSRSGETSIQITHRVDGYEGEVKAWINGCESYLVDYADHIPGYEPAVRGEFTEAFEMIHSAQYANEWLTITKLLRVGDELVFSWEANAGNEVCREAGMVTDRLLVRIKRGGKNHFSFILRYQTGLDNTARMIRRGRYNLGVAA